MTFLVNSIGSNLDLEMAGYKCDNCHKEFLEKDKYNKLRCSGECRRFFCMNCTSLDKATTKILLSQKFNHLRFFCVLCDSPNLKYLNDKVSNLSRNQIPHEVFDSLANRINQLSNSVPTISEMYDMLLQNETKWNFLEKKINDIHETTNLFTTFNPNILLKSVRDMEQNIFNISSVFFNNTEETMKIQVHDSSSAEIKEAIECLKNNVANITRLVKELNNKLEISHHHSNHRPTTHSCLTTSSSTQTVSTSEEPVPPKCFSTPAHSNNQRWHYVVIYNLPVGYTPNQIIHHVKEKLGSAEFIRCYPLINECKGTTFKIGLQSRDFAVKLLEDNIWPPGVSVKWSAESSITKKASTPPPTDMLSRQPSKSVQDRIELNSSSSKRVDLHCPTTQTITSDKHAISVCKSNNFSYRQSIQFLKESQDDANNTLDPMTPPAVRLTKKSLVGNGRYLMARLREPAILASLKLFLAYLHDQPSSVCYEGYTCTSVKVFLASEGLPVDPSALRIIYYNFHESYGIGQAEVDNDLSTYGSYISSERRIHQQKSREYNNRYFSAVSPKKNF